VSRPPAPARYAAEAKAAEGLAAMVSDALPSATVATQDGYVEVRGQWWAAQLFVSTHRFRFATWAGTSESRRFGGPHWMRLMVDSLCEKVR